MTQTHMTHESNALPDKADRSRQAPWWSGLSTVPPTMIVGAIIVAFIVVVALVSIVYTPYDPIHAIAADRLTGPSARHLLGTDRYGRDMASRLMAGSQISMLVGIVAVGIGALGGTPLGIIAAMKRGKLEQFILRGADVVMAFPGLLLAIVSGAIFGASTLSAMVAIGVATIPGFARVARAGTLSIIGQDYIFAARLAHRTSFQIAIRHIIPNVFGLLIVQITVGFSLAILAEAGLSFLGLGTAPPDPSWGRMLADAQSSLGSTPMQAVWPAATIAITVLGFNLLGDGLRDIVDPHRERSV